jgi:uncharacterized RDD family membrane protein YckC
MFGVLSFDAGCMLFRRDRRSLHDLLARTQVVLDAEPRPGPVSLAPR